VDTISHGWYIVVGEKAEDYFVALGTWDIYDKNFILACLLRIYGCLLRDIETWYIEMKIFVCWGSWMNISARLVWDMGHGDLFFGLVKGFTLFFSACLVEISSGWDRGHTCFVASFVRCGERLPGGGNVCAEQQGAIHCAPTCTGPTDKTRPVARPA